MLKPIRKGSRSRRESWRGRHRHEHGYVDNQICFITARCGDRFTAFAGEDAYFDGCIRDELQFRRAYRDTLRRAERFDEFIRPSHFA